MMAHEMFERRQKEGIESGGDGMEETKKFEMWGPQQGSFEKQYQNHYFFFPVGDM